jgi:antitoxin (DNA-binding transcriptional repressor) of toxin-antitoxin stability system
MAATELRIHLGAALRSLDKGDIVIEKGGIPVAVLTRYRRGETPSEREQAYERALAKRGDPAAWPRAFQAMSEGWSGLDAEELKANIRRWRIEGSRDKAYTRGGDPLARQRRLHRPARKERPTR